MTANFTGAQIDALSAPLDRKHVSQRSQAGRQLSYVEGWHCISEANRIFGFDGWSSETVEMKCVAEGERQSSQGRKLYTCTYTARCRVTVYAGSRVIVREGVGAGHGMDQDAGQAHEKAIKEAETDSRKRGLMTFGNPFGLALYDKTQANVADVSEQEAVEAMTQPAPTASEPPAKPSTSERAAAAVQPPAQDRQRQVLDKPQSGRVATNLIAKCELRMAAVMKGSGDLAALKEAHEGWKLDARECWHELLGIDQRRVKAAREKLEAVFAEADAAAERVAKKAAAA